MSERVTGLFIGEQALGNRVVYENLRRAAQGSSLHVEAAWERAGPRLKAMPLPRNLKSGVAFRSQVHELVGRYDPDYLVTNGHKPVAFCQSLVSGLPTAIMFDATPLQFDRLGYLEDPTDRVPGMRTVKYRLVRSLYHRAAALLPWSTWTARSLVDEYAVPADRIHVMPPPIDTRQWAPIRKSRRSLPQIVFVGADFDRKGGPALLEWFDRHGADRAEITLVTTAAVAERPGVRVARASSNSPELLEIVRNADVFVLPTKADCFSIAGQEAMAAGVAVVLGNVGGIPDLVEEGTTGFLVAPGDSEALVEPLDRLLSSEQLRRDMGAAARDHAVSTFDSRVIGERIMEIGEAIVRADGRRARQPSTQAVRS